MSSLIFVVILAVWAVYLVQHWVRRRDHLATARSVDRFSEAMRVLERRRALPRPDVAEHAPASASIPLLRPARPEVVVKRGAPARPVAATAVAPTAAYQRSRRAAELRAAGLLVSSLVMVTLVGLVGFQLIHWAWAFVGIGLLAATVAGVRQSVARGRRARSRQVTRPAAPRQAEASPAEARPQQVASAPGPGLARTARRAVDLQARPPATAPAVALYDVAEVEAQLSQPATAPAAVETAVETPVIGSAPEPAAPGSWDPVPVPPPTYTLKARAYRVPVDLPADGAEMALEEEFEELPQIHRVG